MTTKFAQLLAAVLMVMALVAGLSLATPPAAAQEVTQSTTAGDDATATDTATEAKADGGDVESADTAKVEPKPTGDVDRQQLTPGEGAAGDGADATVAPGAAGWPWWMIGGMLVLLFIVPVLVGNWLAKQVKMPDYGWKISIILATIAAAGLVIGFGQFKFGPDLAGGITLIFELADIEGAGGEAADTDDVAANGDTDGGLSRDLVNKMTGALKRRVDPTGTREVTIRPYGMAIEIIIPKTGQEDLAVIKKNITSLGQLEFRITADRRWGERDQQIIERALELPAAQKTVDLNGEIVAEWVAYDEREFGPVDESDVLSRVVKRLADDRPEALVLRDHYNVTGEYLEKRGTKKGSDDLGRPAVDFAFNTAGSKRFERLTGDNRPNPATGAQRYLGIVLDKSLLSAPSIREKIRDRGQISGGSMTDKDVESIITILEAGSLPAELNPEPISEEVISSTLGHETIEKGKFAIAVSLVAVLLFMMLYYRFAGIVACLALLTNLLLVLGVMVLIEAAFTLPGLAGLVLTVGMSVDANVLIYERIREELNRGAALRMAIRNGFGRATTTIVDANITTLITAVVLYAIGTDQLKGFAITLFLGIVMSMYTAIFCSRVVFDIAERRRWISTLKMSHFIGDTNFDFIGKTMVAGSLSIILIALGLLGVWHRGSEILNIDFTGGTAVTMVLNDEHKMPFSEVHGALEKTELVDKNLTVVERGNTNTRYTITSTVEEVADVQRLLTDTFEGSLKTYHVEVRDVEADGEGNTVATLAVNDGPGYEEEPGVGHDPLMARLTTALEAAGHEGFDPTLSAPGYQTGSAIPFKEWSVKLALPPEEARSVLQDLAAHMSDQPMFPLSNKIGGQVAGDMQVTATYAIFVSLLGIVGYLWLRFQKVTFGLAAVLALVHDVLVTLGMIALSAYIVGSVPVVANALQIDAFQVSLPIVAAFLTIIGYSLNDTIVIFDRIREVRGKSPQLTAEMVNTSINQTLSRTLLTSLTTLLVVVILYFFGGAGIHDFAFSLVVGVIAGTYSTIYVASPALLAMSGTRSAPGGPKAAGKS